MSRQKSLPDFSEDVIVVHTAADTHYWCERFSISPFTLFHLLNTVGNRASQIEEFIHSHDAVRLGNEQKSINPKNFTIL